MFRLLAAVFLILPCAALAQEAHAPADTSVRWLQIYFGGGVSPALGASRSRLLTTGRDESPTAVRFHDQGIGAVLQTDIFVGAGIDFLFPTRELGLAQDFPIYFGLEGFYAGAPELSTTQGHLRTARAAVPLAADEKAGNTDWRAVIFDEASSSDITHGPLYGLSAIIGYPPHEDYLIYVRGGFSRRDSEGHDLGTGGDNRSYSALTGINYGVGLSAVLNSATSLRLEWSRSEDDSRASQIDTNNSQSREIFLSEYRLSLVYHPNKVMMAAPKRHAGLYAGAGFGAEAALVQTSASVGSAVVDHEEVFRADAGNDAVGFNVFGGYGLTLGRIYLGGEAGFASSNIDITTSQVGTFGGSTGSLTGDFNWLRHRLRETLSLSGQLGLTLGPALVYGHAGLARSGINADFFSASDTVGPALLPSSDLWTGSQGMKLNLDGFAYGVGLRIMLDDHFFIRGRFTRVVYEDWGSFARGSITEVGPNLIDVSTDEVERMEYGFSLGYLF